MAFLPKFSSTPDPSWPPIKGALRINSVSPSKRSHPTLSHLFEDPRKSSIISVSLPPTVRMIIAAPNEWFSKTILLVFVKAAKNGDFAKLKILSSNESEVIKQVAKAAPGKPRLEYQDESALEAALKGVDLVISTMCGGVNAQAVNEQTLIETSE